MKRKEFDKQTVTDIIATATAAPETPETPDLLHVPDAPETLDVADVGDEHRMLDDRKPRREYTPEEAAAFAAAGKTKGRKNLSLPRINMAFRPDIHDYITTMARVSGISITEFTTRVFEQHKKEHEEVYQKALEFRNQF